MYHQRSGYLWLCLVAATAVLSACSALPVASPHLNIDSDGYAADERGRAFEKPAQSTGQTAEQREVIEILDAVSARVDQTCSAGVGRAHVMLFVHGGMVSTRAAMKSSSELDASGVFAERGIVPVYINWNSSLFSAMADDLLWVRAGNRAPEGVVVAPVVLATRLVSGLFEAPPNLYYQLIDETRYFQKWPEEQNSAGKIAADGALGLVHAPLTIVSVPLFTGFGRGAWQMMKRRIDVMFAAQKAPKRFFYRKPDQRPGVMRTFMTSLAERRLNWEQQCADFELDFFGHSMGALVGVRMLREFGDLEFNRVVFAAAAASAEDFVTTLPAYLKTHRRSEFFNYGLSVVDEGNELTVKSALFPRGSLLVWVDNFFDPLLSPEDYRVGDYFNKPVFKLPDDAQLRARDTAQPDKAKMILARKQPQETICPRITFVKFAGSPADRADLPRKHGDFNDPDYLARLLDLTLGGRQAIADCEGCAKYDVCAAEYETGN